ncbi:MAG: GH3 auxin-responsive promoter family protein [Flavobacteriales bacterium]|nr:GH3 auxin-responsive promoter family protein [Flavobacteriales bacterium]MCB9448446.1 GH3 auxin-responsive promoter family protein [Flavobacteriales bacterium]
MALINSFISWLMKKRIHQIELFMKYPHEVQAEWFRKLISAVAPTEWGKAHGYDSIKSVEDFRANVPVQDYESLKPYIQRIMRGQQQVLWPSEIKWFAKSSGTTQDKSKFIPVSTESLEECHFKGGKDMLSLYFHQNPDPRLFTGKSLALGGSHTINQFSNESFYGDLSAIIIQNLPFWAEFSRIPGKDIALMDKWETKIEKMARAVLPENVTSISGVPSWTLVLIRRILEISGKNDLKDVWPNLEVFFHGGVNFGPYRKQFETLISGPMQYMETYNASEGFFGIQDQANSDELLLMLDYGIYYEFLPLDQLGSDSPKALSLHEVTTGTNYAPLITTNGGLCRYLVGDTIAFTSLSPYRIRITGRTKNFINAFGEELIIDNAEKALAIATEKTKCEISEYTAGPVYMLDGSKGRHEWLIEFVTVPESLDYFMEVFDNALKTLNSDYEAKRYADMALGRPIIRSLPQGTFYEWLKMKGKLGGQHKVPRLSNDRKIIDEITSMPGYKELRNTA